MANKWIWATVGGTSALLLGGVGAAYAPDAIASLKGCAAGGSEPPRATVAPDSQEEELLVADVNDDMSFNEAFNAAREEVGPGGVFYWHGGVYGTYSEDEWDDMTDEEKSDFGTLAYAKIPEAVDPDNAIRPQDVQQAPDTEMPENGDDNFMAEAQPGSGEGDAQPATSEILAEQPTSNEIVAEQPTSNENVAEGPSSNEDGAQVLGHSIYDGHLTTHIDTNGDGLTDVSVVDADDSWDVTPKDFAIDSDGNVMTMTGQQVGSIFVENGEASQDTNVDDEDDGIAVVGYGEYDGHLMVGYDTNGDGESDFAIIDVDDDGGLSSDDVLMDDKGNAVTLADIEAVEQEDDFLDNTDYDNPSDSMDDGVSL